MSSVAEGLEVGKQARMTEYYAVLTGLWCGLPPNPNTYVLGWNISSLQDSRKAPQGWDYWRDTRRIYEVKKIQIYQN